MIRRFASVSFLLCLAVPAFAQTRDMFSPRREKPVVALRPMKALPQREEPDTISLGDNLVVSAEGLAPGRLYDIRLRDDGGQLVSFLRLSADANGTIAPQVLLYQSGVVGCGAATERHLAQPYRFRTFEEAAGRLRNTTFTIEVRAAGRDSAIVSQRRVAIRPSSSPMAYFSDAKGCLMNATDGTDDVFVTAVNLLPGTIADVAVVEHHGVWRNGDPFTDARTLKEPQTIAVKEGERRFTVPVWRRGEAAVGAWDVIVRPYQSGSDRAVAPFLDYRDIVGWTNDVGIVVYDAHASHLPEQIAGEEIHEYPWFRHADGFALGKSIYGALDPKRKPIGHPGTYAAWYVVEHKASWTTGDALSDVSGGAEITAIKPGCINGTWTLLWPNASPPSITAANPTHPYDVVIDFGNLSQTQLGFFSDNMYTEGIDFVDYYGTVGFWLVRDPRLMGSFAVMDVEQSWGCDTDLDGINITWTDPVFYGNQQFNVAIGDDDDGFGWEDGRCGMQPTLVDMRAHVFYPKDPNSNAVAPGGPFPVVVMYHGQQQLNLDGYNGYADLGINLASHGFIFYSIDARPLLNATISSRGEHIRAHMRKLVALNAPGSGSIYEGKLDLSRVAIAGHSRGGDAIVAAWEWQRVQPDPGYTFKSIIAIAPVQFFDSPTAVTVEPAFRTHFRDVPYMIIHGSRDGDVSDFQGLRTYDRAADIRQPGQTPKSMVFVQNANHNFFNARWEQVEGNDYNGMLPVLSGTDSRDVTKVYIHAAAEAWLKNRDEYVYFLNGTIPYPGAATVALDYQNAAAESLLIDSHEVIPPALHNAATNNAGGAITTPNIQDYAERQLDKSQPLPWNSYRGDTFAGSLSWDAGTDMYTTEVPASIRSAIVPNVHTTLAMRVGQVFRNANSPNPANANQDFAVRLHDTDGDFSPWVFVRDFAQVFPPWVSEECCTKTVMDLVRIPLQVFTTNTSSNLDISKLDRIEFAFSAKPKGEIVIDDIRLTK